MHDPFDEHYDQMEHELDSDHAPQNGPWLNQLAFSGPALDHDAQNDLFLSDFYWLMRGGGHEWGMEFLEAAMLVRAYVLNEDR